MQVRFFNFRAWIGVDIFCCVMSG